MEASTNGLSKVDPTFRKVKPNAICFYIWQTTEDNRMEMLSTKDYGVFTNDGAYIIYAASTPGDYVHQDSIVRLKFYFNSSLSLESDNQSILFLHHLISI